MGCVPTKAADDLLLSPEGEEEVNGTGAAAAKRDQAELWRRIEQHYSKTGRSGALIPLAVQHQPRAPLIARDAMLRVPSGVKDTLKFRAAAIIDTFDRLVMDVQTRAPNACPQNRLEYGLLISHDPTCLPRLMTDPRSPTRRVQP
eukprot:RCo039830